MSVPSPEPSSSHCCTGSRHPALDREEKRPAMKRANPPTYPTPPHRGTHRNLCYWSSELSEVHHPWPDNGKVFSLQLLGDSSH